MSESLIIMIFALCLGVIVYIILDLKSEEEEILSDRLSRISKIEETESGEKKKTKFTDGLMSFYLDPIIEHMKKKKVEKGPQVSKNDLRVILMQAGKPFSDDDVLKLSALQAFACIIALVIGLVLGLVFLRDNLMIMIAFIVLFTMFGYKGPIFKLRMEIKKRCQEIMYNLPDSLDLLVVCVEAGLGLDAALTRVATEQMRTAPVLAREFGRVSKDILAGVPRQEAFRNLGLRNDVDDLKSLVALLIQTDKLGTSISQSLRIYSDTVRTKRRQKAEKLASEASVKMVIPLVLFILPSMFVVLLGPAILNLIEQFAGGI